MTNAEEIKSMTVDELAKKLSSLGVGGNDCYECGLDNEGYCFVNDCIEGKGVCESAWYRWLNDKKED